MNWSVNWSTYKNREFIIKWAILQILPTYPDQLYGLAETDFVAGKINAKGIGCILIDTNNFWEISIVSNKYFWNKVVFFFWLKG